jgi:hypothetical protein
LFWTHADKLAFLEGLAAALAGPGASVLEGRRAAIFGTDWRLSFRGRRGQAFLQEEVARKRLTGETQSLRSLVAFVLRKMRHVCETARAANLEPDPGQRLDVAVLDFVTAPFPGLFTETYTFVD